MNVSINSTPNASAPMKPQPQVDQLVGMILKQAQKKNESKFDPDQIKKWFGTLLEAGRSTGGKGYVELRIMSQGSVLSGLFDDPNAIAEQCAQHSGTKHIYAGLNPRKPEALAVRTLNQLSHGAAYGAEDVESYEWLYIDLDPERPTDTSATYEEIESACGVFKEVYTFLKGKNIPCYFGLSGNGVHIQVRLTSTPVSKDFKRNIGFVLKFLHRKFGTEQVKVDGSVNDPARICRFYGAMNVKGLNTTERPHRFAHLFYP